VNIGLKAPAVWLYDWLGGAPHSPPTTCCPLLYIFTLVNSLLFLAIIHFLRLSLTAMVTFFDVIDRHHVSMSGEIYIKFTQLEIRKKYSLSVHIVEVHMHKQVVDFM